MFILFLVQNVRIKDSQLSILPHRCFENKCQQKISCTYSEKARQLKTQSLNALWSYFFENNGVQHYTKCVLICWSLWKCTKKTDLRHLFVVSLFRPEPGINGGSKKNYSTISHYYHTKIKINTFFHFLPLEIQYPGKM